MSHFCIMRICSWIYHTALKKIHAVYDLLSILQLINQLIKQLCISLLGVIHLNKCWVCSQFGVDVCGFLCVFLTM